MPVGASAAYATYRDYVPLNEVLTALAGAGFDKESICMLLSPAHPIATIMRESSTRPFEREASIATAGLMNWLSEFGAVVIPTFGFFIRSRTFLRPLLMERETVYEYGHRGTLVSLGFSQADAERFEDQVRDVGVLLYVACPEIGKTRWAVELLRATGAEEAGLVENEIPMEALVH